MGYIDKDKHINQIVDTNISFNISKIEDYEEELDTLNSEMKKLLSVKNNQFLSTFLLERNLWLEAENKIEKPVKDTLSRGRIVLVNPGISGIGREQRFVHPYIVLGEHQETFIGVPITNMAYNKDKEHYYLRHFFEVELINPSTPKKFTEYRCSKRSVADVRNIAGIDKRRIIQNELYEAKKYVPDEYLNAISEKIRNSLAIL